MHNSQTFSLQSDQYAKHRPTYPASLFAYLNSLLDHHDRAWDCATGNGQAAISCANYFARVTATDISAEQIRQRLQHPRVTYGVCSAEQAPFENQSLDLIIVAQALHWFNLEQFYPEVLRVLKRGGVLAVWGYAFFNIQPDIDQIIAQNLLEPIDPFWAEGNRKLMAGYRTIPFPLDEISSPPTFEMQLEWNLNQLADYLRTWSAVKRYSAQTGIDPVSQLEIKLKEVWDSPDRVRLVHMPLFFRAGRKFA